MDDVEALLADARALLEQIVSNAGDRLRGGAEIARIHGHFVERAMRLGEDVEAQALLAGSGDRDALATMRESVQMLRALRAELRGEAWPG
jgi:hypothetical protein